MGVVDFLQMVHVEKQNGERNARAVVTLYLGIERVNDNEPRWLRFPGTWGEAQYIAAPPFGIAPLGFGTSPVGPAFQDDWLDPLGTIAGYAAG